MDAFINILNDKVFESTNSLWNQLRLNDPWSIGYVTILIEQQTFANKEEWEAFYYESGEKRIEAIQKLTQNLQEKLNNEQLITKHRVAFNQLDNELKKLNYNFGRTKKEIAQKGKILFHYTQKKGIDISKIACIEAVRFRTICQTWNGIILRERNTIKSLKVQFPELSFISTDGTFDFQFAVDYEVKKGETLICGIQIKPKSYLGNKLYLQHAKAANIRKNQLYFNRYQKPVFNVIATTKGEIINQKVLQQIKYLSTNR